MKLTGVSLGPGDPGLITRRAWEALTSGARWLYPVKRSGGDSYALDIARRAGLSVPEDAVPLVFPMTRQAEVLERAWQRAARQVISLAQESPEFVFLVEGDASTFATFGHLARTLEALAPGWEIETLPGVPSFVAAAAAAGVPLAEEDDRVAVIPAAYGIGVIEHLLDEFDTVVLLKVKPLLDEILALLARRGLLEQTFFCEKVGAPEQRLVRDVTTLRGEHVNYLSLLIVRQQGLPRGELRRGCRKKPQGVPS
jgi:precorrin-2/cobalt-factor-2 C20-methyltransferase